MAVENLEHALRLLILEPRPAHQLIGAAAISETGCLQPVLARREDTARKGTTKRLRLGFFPQLDLVQAADEEEIG